MLLPNYRKINVECIITQTLKTIEATNRQVNHKTQAFMYMCIYVEGLIKKMVLGVT